MSSWSNDSARTESVLHFSNELSNLHQVLGRFIFATAGVTNLSSISALNQGTTRPNGVRRILMAAPKLRVANEK